MNFPTTLHYRSLKGGIHIHCIPMKTTPEQLAIYRALEAKATAAIQSAKDKLLIANGSACLCNEDGGPISDEQALDSHATLSVDVIYWQEGIKTMTQSGRAKLAREHQAADEILDILRNAGTTTPIDGDSIEGPLYGVTLDLVSPATP